MEAVREFLEANNLGQYVTAFETNGFDDLEIVGYLAEKEEYRAILEKVIPKHGHQIKFIEAWKRRFGSNTTMKRLKSVEFESLNQNSQPGVDALVQDMQHFLATFHSGNSPRVQPSSEQEFTADPCQGQGLRAESADVNYTAATTAADSFSFQNMKDYLVNLLHRVSTVLNQTWESVRQMTNQLAYSQLFDEIGNVLSSTLNQGKDWLVAHPKEVIGILILVSVALLVYFRAGPAHSLTKSAAAIAATTTAAETRIAKTTTTAAAETTAAKTADLGEMLQNLYNIVTYSANVGSGFTGLGYQVV